MYRRTPVRDPAVWVASRRPAPPHQEITAFQGSTPGFFRCAPGGTRTPDPLIKSQQLYPLSYRGRSRSRAGTEPGTPGLRRGDQGAGTV